MKIFVLSPNVDSLLSPPQIESLNNLGELFVVKDIQPLMEVSQLFEGDEPRILAIDPDFCDWQVDNTFIDKIPNLKAICLQTTSFSWIDVDHAKSLGIPVVNLRGFSTVAVAEWATMMVLALARRLPMLISDGWKMDYFKHRGVELRGMTAGVIGLGKIGVAIAENMAGLGMKVQYFSNSSRDERFELVSLDELMKTSDVILPAVAKNLDTIGMISQELAYSMKPSAIFVSIVHEVYDHPQLVKMVGDGKLFGYGFEEDKLAYGKYEGNIWDGPALGWCTSESMSKNSELWVQSIAQAVNGELPYIVNG